MLMDRTERMLIKHEGLRTKVYTCPANKLTIGVGRNLEDRGITKKEALYLLNNDIVECDNKLSLKLPFYDSLDDVRQEVLINMCFQLGFIGLSKFKKTLKYINDFDFEKASQEMLDSAWAKQTPNRANELAQILRKGEY